MKICSANLYYNVSSKNESPDAFLDRMPLLKEVPAALAAAGNEMSVVQLFPAEASFTRAGVHYHFVRPAMLEKSWARLESAFHRQNWTRYTPSVGAVRKILAQQPDVVHFHRLTPGRSLYLLQLLGGNDRPAIVAQYHGGQLTEGRLARKFHASSLAQTQRVLFSRREKAEPFLADGLLQESQIVQLTDQSTKLTMRSRPEARQETGIEGSPVFLWYSNLEPERDPMTAVLGFERLLQEWNKAQLYMYYGGDELLTQLRAYVIANPALIGRIHFRSRAFSQPPESVFNSADFLLQTDLLANNGHAVIDAMACGVIPVVSDTAQFRSLVDNGRCGFLFPPGDAKAMAKQLLKFSPGKISGRAALVHAWFEAAYSYEAMAGLLLDVYAEAIGERQAQLRALNEPAPEGSS